MKKTLLITMIFSLAFAFGAFALAQDSGNISSTSNGPVPQLIMERTSAYLPGSTTEQRATGTQATLEKIVNTKEANLFEKIQRIGDSYWGIRKQLVNHSTSTIVRPDSTNVHPEMATSTRQTPNQNMYISSSTKAVLEKIAHPNDIKLYEKIQKIGTALWGIKKQVQDKIVNKLETKPTTSPVTIKPETTQCITDAITKKDTATKTALSAHLQNLLGNMDTRNSCQLNLFSNATSSIAFANNKNCIDTYVKSKQGNDQTLNKTRNEIWNAYKADLQKCYTIQMPTSASSTINHETGSNFIVNDGEEIK